MVLRMEDGRRRKLLRAGVVLLYVAAVVLLAAGYGVQRTYVLSYSSLNGDFQSFNVFRRVLAGQRPYADFANYIGMAPIVVNQPFFVLLGGNFAASLFATNFTACLLFSFTVLMLFWLVSGSMPLAMVVSVVFPKLVSSGLLSLLVGPRWSYYATSMFEALYTPSNSTRITRVALPFLLVLGCCLFKKAYAARRGRPWLLVAGCRSLVFCAVAGGVVGLCLPWSNDYGLAVAFSASLILVLLLARQRLPVLAFLGRVGVYFACLAVFALAAAAVASGGHPAAYFSYLLGTGGYQYFYFNGMGGRAPLAYLFTNWRLLAFTAPALGWLVFCAVRLVQNRLTDRMTLLGFLALSVLVATYIYIAGGSGYAFTEALEGYTWLAALALAGRGAVAVVRRWRRARVLRAAPALVLAALFAVNAVLLVRDAAGKPETVPGAVYAETLGGWVPYPRAIEEAAALTAGREVFSVYATGLEAATGQMQPSGYDYIIHALGDDARARYVESFIRGEYAFAQTSSLGTENWLCVQNWDFYRELYAGYRPVAETEYSQIWQKTGGEALDIVAEVTVSREGGRWVITVTADTETDFTADVSLAYSTAFKSGWGAFLSLGRRLGHVACPDLFGAGADGGANMPAGHGAWRVPVAVRGGAGRAVVWAGDTKYAEMTELEAAFLRALPDIQGYVPAQ